jgi:sugar phosphate isomerase/epimerase
MTLRDRIGIDVGRRLRLEDAIEWAAEHQVRWIDIQLDAGANALPSFDERRADAVRRACAQHKVHLGLHTSSAVNVAEVAPFVSDAVDRYLEAYVEIAPRLGAEWIVMHAGFHFTSDKAQRMAAGLDRLKRIGLHAPQPPGSASPKLIRSRCKRSFDNLVGLAEQLRRRREAEMLCRFYVVISWSADQL